MSKKAPSYETHELREFARVLTGRRTIDQYLHTPVPEDLVREAIEVATWAPNHYVTEPWRFILPGPQTIARIIDLNADIVSERKSPELGEHKRRIWREKPGWLIVMCPRSEDSLREQEDYAACCTAVHNFTLYLWKAGIGSKWTTGPVTRDPRLFDIIDADFDAEFVVGLLWYGYPKITPQQTRKPVDDVLTELP
jgi:nitroreductase